MIESLPAPVVRQSRLISNQDRVVELLATRGFSDVGLREMAASLDVTAAAFYHHFASKDEYLVFLLEAHYDACLQAITGAGRPLGCITQIIEKLIELQDHRKWYFKLAVREADRLSQVGADNEVLALRAQIEQRLFEVLTVDSGATLPANMLLTLLEHLLVWTCAGQTSKVARKQMINTLMVAAAQSV